MNSAKPLSSAFGRSIRKEFPFFSGKGRAEAAYLDSAATAQKPAVVIERMSAFLSNEYANVHRGAYQLSAAATEQFEAVRAQVARHIGAKEDSSIIFTRGTTESINLAAYSLESFFAPGDTILLAVMDHHSNIVPWQLVAKRRGLKIEFVDMTDSGALDQKDFERKLRELKPKLFACTALSNTFGAVVPVQEVTAKAKQAGAKVLIDAAQAIVHDEIDVSRWGVDFTAFSGHKLYGPSGVGVLYVEPGMYEFMEPFLGGGNMIETVGITGSTWAEPPRKFEAGTAPIAEVIGLGEAISFIERLDRKKLKIHEEKLVKSAIEILSAEPGVTVYGPGAEKGAQSSIVSFNLAGVHPHDLSTIADSHGVQFRAGHHCAMPTMVRLGLQATARISFGCYSDLSDLDLLLEAIRHSRSIFS